MYTDVEVHGPIKLKEVQDTKFSRRNRLTISRGFVCSPGIRAHIGLMKCVESIFRSSQYKCFLLI